MSATCPYCPREASRKAPAFHCAECDRHIGRSSPHFVYLGKVFCVRCADRSCPYALRTVHTRAAASLKLGVWP